MQNIDPASPDLSWVPFRGGELEGVRPARLCRACRAAGETRSEARQQAICFACYRAALDHDRRLKAAGQFDAASEERFVAMGPLAPVNQTRLNALRAARALARVGLSPWAVRRLAAVRAARLALASAPAVTAARTEKTLPLPAAWLPFVVDEVPRQHVG